MKDKRRRFILLQRHTDEEITDFLQSEAEKGWHLESTNGNIFCFKKRSYDNKRLCSYTFLSRDPDTKTEGELRKELVALRKNGWNMISITGPESITDSRRHAFLKEEKEGSAIPKTEEEESKRAKKSAKRKMLSNLIISLMYVVFASFLFYSDLIRITANTFYLFSSVIFASILVVCLFLSIRTLLSLKEEKKDKESYIKKRRYRYLDHSTLLIFLSLLLLVIFLSFDFLYGGSNRGGERVKIGDSEVRIFNDEIPLSILDGPYEIKTSMHQESKSPLASYSYSYEQLFGSNTLNTQRVSYTIYSSPIKALRDAAERSLTRSHMEPQIIKNIEVFRSNTNLETIIRKDNDFIYIRSGFALSEDEILQFSSLL